MNKANYNPLFLHMLTQQSMEDIPDAPTLSNFAWSVGYCHFE